MPLGTLPKSGKKLWESVYNEAKASGDSKETAAQKAWGAVKNGWKKKDGKWIKKSELIQSFSMFISKATKDGKVMRWQAVNSDTDPDSHAERMSLELYQDFISHIENKDPIPEVLRSAVCSKWWCGGNPYVSVSHYLDLDGKAVPGEPTRVFVDGNKLKAKGVLYDTPLGHATYRSLVSDKDKSLENKIRISIGFLDLAHKHGENGSVWIRESTTSVCPECFDGVGDKIYVRGYLVHLAMTRVPVNKRTQMVLEEKSEMSKKIPTRKEDAASIVGEDLANQIDAVSKSTVMDSNALVEMSEEPTAEETQELVAEAEKPEEVPSAEVETKSKAKEEKPEDEEDDEEDDKEEEKVEKKSEVPPVEEKAESPSDSPDDVISIKNAATAITKAIDELKSVLAEFSQASVTVNNATVDKSENVHALKPALDAILASVDNSITIEGDLNAKLQFVQPSINELGQAIMDYVQTKSIVSEEKEPAAQNKDNLIDDIKKLIQPFVEEIGSLKSEVGILKAQQKVENVQIQPRIPQPRTQRISPNLTAKSEEKPKSSIRSIVNKSVGLPENS